MRTLGVVFRRLFGQPIAAAKKPTMTKMIARPTGEARRLDDLQRRRQELRLVASSPRRAGVTAGAAGPRPWRRLWGR